MGAVAARAVVSTADRASERRTKRRYPIHLEVQYKLLRHRRVERLGAGRTLNISSGGVLFEADGLINTTGPIELALNWPFLLHGSCNLKLVIRGRIVRTNNRVIAIRAEFHEFRTAGAHNQFAEGIEAPAAVRVMTA